MKIIEKHPKFYTDYKDKTIIKNMYLKGTVIGYCVMYNNKIALMVQTEKIGFDGFFEYTIKKNNIKPKDLIGIPWMVAFALRSSLRARLRDRR